MLIARLTCSGAECEAELELVVEDLAELDRLAEGLCDCGYGMGVLAVSEVELLAAG